MRPLLGLFVRDVQIWSNGSLVDLLGSLVCILKIELFIEPNVWWTFLLGHVVHLNSIEIFETLKAVFFGRIGCSVSSKVDQKAATQVLSKIWVIYLMQSQRQATQTFCLLSLFKQNFKEGLIIFICSIIRYLRRVWIEILKLWKNKKKKNREWGTRAQEVCRKRRSQNLREKLDVSHITNNLVFWVGRWSAEVAFALPTQLSRVRIWHLVK